MVEAMGKENERKRKQNHKNSKYHESKNSEHTKRIMRRDIKMSKEFKQSS